MKVAFAMPCRDKAFFVSHTVRSILRQTYSPMEILLSDQGSTDESLKIIEDAAQSYNGPNTVRVLHCPDTGPRGAAGQNAHVNWIHTQTDADVLIWTSADDLNHPHRAAEVVKAYEEHNPSSVATMTQFAVPEIRDGQMTGTFESYTGFPDSSRFVTSCENIEHLVGSSSSASWSHDLFDKYGPFEGLVHEDMTMPFYATLERGLFYLHVPLHIYMKHADANNTGLEGIHRAAKTDDERNASTELIHYHITSSWCAILRKLGELGVPLDNAVKDAILMKALQSANAWAISRDKLTLDRVKPMSMVA